MEAPKQPLKPQAAEIGAGLGGVGLEANQPDRPSVDDRIGASALGSAVDASASEPRRFDGPPGRVSPPPPGTMVSKATSTPPGERVPVGQSATVRANALNSPDRSQFGPNVRS